MVGLELMFTSGCEPEPLDVSKADHSHWLNELRHTVSLPLNEAETTDQTGHFKRPVPV